MRLAGHFGRVVPLRILGPAALLGLLAIALYAPGLATIPPFDRDEARFAQASRQMLQSGDFVRIRFQNEARDKKPILIYWLQAGSAALFSTPKSHAIWPYRLPSALGASLAVLLVFTFARRLFPDDRHAPLAAALLMASALGLVAEAHLAKTDAALLATVVAGQGALGAVYVRARAGQRTGSGMAWLFWVAEALGILLKGPIAPMIAVLTIAALSIADRDIRWAVGLRPLRGVLLTVAIVSPWLFAIERATEGQFLARAVGRDLLPKLLGGQDAHGAPPGYYLLLVTATFWPGSLYLVPALWRGWRRRTQSPERFLLAWLVPAWLLFELVPTKLPHYVLPLYPALALLAGRALGGILPAQMPRWPRILDRVVRALWGMVSLAMAALLVALPVFFGSGVSAAAILGAIAVIGLAAALFLRRERYFIAPALAFVFVLTAASVLPGLGRMWLSRSAAALVARDPPPTGEPVVSVGYSEPSLVFLLGTKTALLPPSRAADALARGGRALVSNADTRAFLAALAANGLAAQRKGSVRGLDYSDGKKLVLTLYVVRPRGK